MSTWHLTRELWIWDFFWGEELCKWILNEKYCSFAKKMIAHTIRSYKKGFCGKKSSNFPLLFILLKWCKKVEKNEAQIQSIYVTMEKCNYAFPVNQSILGNGLRRRTKECKKRRHFLMFQSILSRSLKVVENSP